MLEHFDDQPQRIFLQLNNASETLNQDDADRLADDKIFIEEAGGEEKVSQEFQKSEIINLVKFNLVCKKVR